MKRRSSPGFILSFALPLSVATGGGHAAALGRSERGGEGSWKSLSCLAVLAAVLCFPVQDAAACSYAFVPQLRLDPEQYTFGGTVIAHFGPVQARGIRGEIWVTRVAVEEVVSGPTTLAIADVFEVDPCTTSGASLEWLEKLRPVGTEVLVSARLSTSLASDGEVPRLETGAHGFIGPSPIPLAAAASRVIDYRGFCEMWEEELRGRGFRGVAMGFEFQKELVRLEEGTPSEKFDLLMRLAGSGRDDANFRDLVKEHLGEGREVEEVLQEAKRSRDEQDRECGRYAGPDFTGCLASGPLKLPPPFDDFGYGDSEVLPAEPLESPKPNLSGVGDGGPARTTAGVELAIGADGEVDGVRIRLFEGPPAAREIIIQTLCRWRFRPATENGVPIAVRDTIEVEMTRE